MTNDTYSGTDYIPKPPCYFPPYIEIEPKEKNNFVMKVYILLQNIFFWVTTPLWKLACWIEDREELKQ